MSNKLILHFDARNTLFVSDFNSRFTTEKALNTYISGLAWGSIVEDQWQMSHQEISTDRPDSSLISFYKYMENKMVRTPEDRPKLREKLGKFTQENGIAFQEIYFEHLEKLEWNYEYQPDLTVKGNCDKLYHYILPTFFQTISHLYKNKRDFAIIIRTFGLDIPPILRAIKAFINGKHPMFPTEMNINLCDWQNELVMDTNNKEYIYKFKSCNDREIETTSDEEEIVNHWNSISGIAAVKDDFQYWCNHNFHYTASKPLWINYKFEASDNICHHIFFDDCIRPRDTDSIVHLRYLKTSRADPSIPSNGVRNKCSVLDQQQTEKYLNINLVQSDLLDCIRNNNYFIDKINNCEKNFSLFYF